MRRNLTNEPIQQTPFGRFTNTKIEPDNEIDEDINGYEPDISINADLQEENTPIREKKQRRKLFGSRPKRNKTFSEPEQEIQPLCTGQTTAIDVIAPSSVDNGSRDYVVVDGIYHAYLYIAGYGYRTRNEAAWLSALVEAGDNIGISFSFKRMQRDKILSRIAQKTMINRSKMREVADTRSDFEELDSAISSGMYLKEGMNRANQDFYYMSTILEVTAEDEETLERSVSDTITLCSSMDMVCKRADYKHEQGFLSALPTVTLDADLERKSRRNILTDSLAAAFPFSSFEVYDPEGIFLGLNKYNNSLAILDIFDADKYNNANVCILGMSGAGKTFLMQLIALRLRQQGVQVFIIAPLKGHEFAEVSDKIGGKYIKIAPSSQDCINIMEIRKKTLNTDYEIYGDKRNDSILAEKIQKLMIFFSLIKNDITQNELNLIDGAIVRTYKAFGITYDNNSLYDKDGRFKKMPTLKDLYNELLSKDKTKDLALMIEKFAVGSLASFGGSTNVDLDNKYIVLDISEMSDHLKALGMFIALDFVWDKAKESRIQKKAIFIDELWTLTGEHGNSLAGDYVVEIEKVIRGYGGGLITATQDVTDSFTYNDGKYGKAIINNSRIKFILQLEEDEAFTVQKYLGLSDEETMQIIRSNRGEALLCANRNKLVIDIKASPYVYDLITTKRSDLEKKRRRKQEE
jgi:type IV secretory pathway VirB4 component